MCDNFPYLLLSQSNRKIMSLDFREAACSCMMQMFGRAMGITAVEDLYRSEVAGDWLKSPVTYTIKCVFTCMSIVFQW